MLDEKDWGDIQIKWMLQDGVPVEFNIEETILEVSLANPIGAGKSTTLEMEFYVQTPAMIRRSGKNSEDNVAFYVSVVSKNYVNMMTKGGTLTHI